MSQLSLYRLRAQKLQLAVLIAFLLVLNVSHFVMQRYSVMQQADRLVELALEQPHETGARWLTASTGLILQLAPSNTHYIAMQNNDAVLYIDEAFIIKPTLWLYFTINSLLLLLILPIGLSWRRQRRARTSELVELDKSLHILEVKVEAVGDSSASFSQRLQKVSDQVNNLVRRDQEVRHLVRVQGLIDHELAIGNRVFFESKLQHYLSDVSEVGFGALFIIQLSHPETISSNIKPLNRLRGCVDILHGMASDYANTVIARLSDNDLVLLIAGLSAKDMEKLGDRMATLLSRASCFADCVDQDVLHIGYASYQRGQTSYQVLSEADMALKTAQLHGPNAAYGFVYDDRPQAKGSVWWRSELNKALQDHRFALSFQPVFSWQDRDILQHEVLIRLQSADGGYIPAAIFLPMAYNCGLACQIDQHVLLKTARLCAMDSRTFTRCSVNISIHSLLDPQWWQWLEHMLISGQLDPQQFALELTEHHLLRHYKTLKSKLLKLNKLGFSLIVDHVGLVIDNAVYVNELPLESVKLHPSVVRNIDQHLEQQLFVRGLIASYVGKGVRVIATGVELESEWLTLQKLGIAGGQGFYFSQPLNQIIAQGQIQ
ncbi:EAL domain-containing protein [Rheinheimera baltica]|uniref:EAL domain-containing protein n=1 Tax=Rheinheimera baltica TaxID=67576 RepID=UPI00273EE43D|nr:EAL domain-containing protein [Rheinheimera baltica]MDP5142588.1 EAL domain-containing protein [Rheinheimera baltica]MDP5151897.1 EAL domain-containing protein [Rheinheimera baltica]